MTFVAPEYHLHEEFKNRSQKLQEIKELGVDPYPPKFNFTSTPGALTEKYGSAAIGHSEEAQEGKTPSATVAGRLVLFRAMGKNAFAHLQDETGRIQVMFNRDHTQVIGYTPSAELSPIKFIEKKLISETSLALKGTSSIRKRGN